MSAFESLINAVWGFMNTSIDFSLAGFNVSASLWEIFMASTLIYILCVWTRYVTGGFGKDHEE